MLILKRLDGLLNPKGSLAKEVRPNEIAEANRQVQSVLREESGGKCGQYNKYSEAERAEMGKYACCHGSAAAARYFARKLGKPVNKSTIRAIKKSYTEELKKRSCECDQLQCLPQKKRGRKVILGADLNDKVQAYVEHVRDGSGTVSSKIVIAAAKGILLSCNRSLLSENGGPIVLTH